MLAASMLTDESFSVGPVQHSLRLVAPGVFSKLLVMIWDIKCQNLNVLIARFGETNSLRYSRHETDGF